MAELPNYISADNKTNNNKNNKSNIVECIYPILKTKEQQVDQVGKQIHEINTQIDKKQKIIYELFDKVKESEQYLLIINDVKKQMIELTTVLVKLKIQHNSLILESLPLATQDVVKQKLNKLNDDITKLQKDALGNKDDGEMLSDSPSTSQVNKFIASSDNTPEEQNKGDIQTKISESCNELNRFCENNNLYVI